LTGPLMLRICNRYTSRL